jgi:hypothetical protein
MVPSLFILFVMLAALGSGVWIGFALLGTGVIALEWYRDMPIARVLAQDLWARLNADELVTLPLFILMGDILYHTRLSESLFRGLARSMECCRISTGNHPSEEVKRSLSTGPGRLSRGPLAFAVCIEKSCIRGARRKPNVSAA